MQNKNISFALFLIIIVSVIGGGGPVFSKIALEQIPPFTFTFLRFLLGFFCILPFFLKEKPRFNKDLFGIGLFSLFAVGNVIFFAFGIKQTSATVAQMIYATTPIIVTVISIFLLKEKLRAKKIIGILLGFLGTMLIVLLPVIENHSQAQGTIIGNLIIFIAVFSFSLYTVLSRKFQRKYSPTYLTTAFFFISAVIALFFSLTEIHMTRNLVSTISGNSLIGLLYMGTFGSFLFYLLYQYSIKKSSPVITSLLFYIQPAATIVWAALLLGEKLTGGFIIGSVFSLFGAWLVTRK